MNLSVLSDLIETLRFHDDLIFSSLESIDYELLEASPIKNAGTFGKQFSHILDIRKCYLDALRSGILDFYRRDVDHSLENNKQALLGELRSVLVEICRIVSAYDERKVEDKWIDCTPSIKYLGENHKRISPLQVIGLITELEVFHEGELALYFRSAKIRFPRNWIAWGLI
ncbi:MAG: hypothetical protein ACYDAO_02965 [Thermoplasmataceae archaeon]